MKLSFAKFLILFLAGLCLARQASANQARQPSREEARAIVEAICPGDGQVRGATLNGCGTCPDFTGTPGPAMNNRLGNILFGSFTKPGTAELVVEFLNCELGLNDERGSVLLQKSRSGWRRIGYAPGLGGLSSTYKLKDGRDLILASAAKSWMGEITSSAGVYDFTATPERRWLLLISVVDTTPQFCDSKTVTAAWIEKMEIEDLNRDGAPDLRISVRWAEGIEAPADAKTNCAAEFRPSVVPVHTIDYLFDGARFHVAPSSVAELKIVAGLYYLMQGDR